MFQDLKPKHLKETKSKNHLIAKTKQEKKNIKTNFVLYQDGLFVTLQIIDRIEIEYIIAYLLFRKRKRTFREVFQF